MNKQIKPEQVLQDLEVLLDDQVDIYVDYLLDLIANYCLKQSSRYIRDELPRDDKYNFAYWNDYGIAIQELKVKRVSMNKQIKSEQVLEDLKVLLDDQGDIYVDYLLDLIANNCLKQSSRYIRDELPRDNKYNFSYWNNYGRAIRELKVKSQLRGLETSK